jgi:hypothetical protein
MSPHLARSISLDITFNRDSDLGYFLIYRPASLSLQIFIEQNMKKLTKFN